MKENELKIALIKALNDGLTLFGVSGVLVLQSYQPNQTGAELQDSLYIHKISDKRYGYNARSDKWNDDDSEMVHVEKQVNETTFQVNALVKTDITNPVQMTVTDLLGLAADILAHETTRDFLKSKKVGILRITDLNNPFFSDSRDQNESSPSFSVVLTHTNERVSTSPVVETCEFGLHRV